MGPQALRKCVGGWLGAPQGCFVVNCVLAPRGEPQGSA